MEKGQRKMSALWTPLVVHCTAFLPLDRGCTLSDLDHGCTLSALYHEYPLSAQDCRYIPEPWNRRRIFCTP